MRLNKKRARPKNTVVVVFLTVLMTLALVGCYPKAVGPPGYDGKPMTWPEMDKAERKAHMKDVVMPRAAAVFREWRPEKYTAVNCTLCHGDGAKTDNFHMPTAHLPRLSGELLLGPEFAKYPDTTQLKLDRLVPEMADALGVKSFSVITRRGFGCYSCHLGPDGPMFGH
ncbi:MAG: hypothetical protein ABIL58_13725 [Pseudomonadota bacterium]